MDLNFPLVLLYMNSPWDVPIQMLLSLSVHSAFTPLLIAVILFSFVTGNALSVIKLITLIPRVLPTHR